MLLIRPTSGYGMNSAVCADAGHGMNDYLDILIKYGDVTVGLEINAYIARLKIGRRRFMSAMGVSKDEAIYDLYLRFKEMLFKNINDH